MLYRDLVLGYADRYIGLDLESCHDNYRADHDINWTPEGTIPLDDDSVDSALCIEVIEHCPYPSSVLGEIARVLRPGGTLVLTVPFLWPLHDPPNDFCRHTPWSMERLVRSAGFSRVDVEPTGGWHASMASMLGLWLERAPRDLTRPTDRLLLKVLWKIAPRLIRRLADTHLEPHWEHSMITGVCVTAEL
jgi:SAM-dependent methyltransferase